MNGTLLVKTRLLCALLPRGSAEEDIDKIIQFDFISITQNPNIEPLQGAEVFAIEK